MGAPATATARTVGSETDWLSIRITLVGTPTITVALAAAAVSRQCSALQCGSRSMINAAPRRRQYRHIPPMPWVNGVIGRTRSSSVMSSLEVKLSKVTCFSRAESEASLGMPVVPELRAISTMRAGSGAAIGGVGRPPAGPLSASNSALVTTSRGCVLPSTQPISCSPNASGSGTMSAPISGIASSSATYCQTFGSLTPTTSPARTPLAASSFCNRRTCASSCSNDISAPPSQIAALEPRRAAFHSR